MNLALFDFDGTITETDTWTPFMRLAVPRLGPAAWALLAPVARGFGVGVVSGSRGRAIAVRVALAGQPAEAIRRVGREYASSALPRAVRPDVLQRIDWHRGRGDRVVVVSAALDVYLEPWCRAHELEVVCTRLEERDGRLTGRYRSPDCCGAEKVRRLRAVVDPTQYDTVYAYGDSADDRELLECAHEPFFRGRPLTDWAEVGGARHPRERREARPG